MASGPDMPQQGDRTTPLNGANAGLMRTPSGLGAKPGFPIARQPSIYSLTIDEFQNVMGEPGKVLGSMNMDEFLKNIWTAEESQAMAAAMGGVDDAEGIMGQQHSLQRQGSLSLPRTLSRKTVDEVWKDISRVNMEPGSSVTSGGQERDFTFGETTLEDFLVKAGVMREDDSGSQSLVNFGLSLEGDFVSLTNHKNTERQTHGNILGVNVTGRAGEEEKVRVKALPTLSLSPTNASSVQTGMESVQLDRLKHTSHNPQQNEWLTNNQYRAAFAHQHRQQNILQQQAVEAAYANMNNRAGNGAVPPIMGSMGVLGNAGLGLSGGPGAGMGPTSLGLKTGSPPSPGSDGVGHSPGVLSTLSPLPYALDASNLRGRKRGQEGSLEKVVERRQRRMIKNRESAARSRARKQAYTVELEAEVTQLKEENMRLCRQEAEMVERRKQQILDMMASFAQHFTPKSSTLRRTRTGPW